MKSTRLSKIFVSGLLIGFGIVLGANVAWPHGPTPEGAPTKRPEDKGWLDLLDTEHAPQWKNLGDDKDIFEIVDGMLHVHGHSLFKLRYATYTGQTFDDFELHVEYKLAKRANSGVFLRTQPNDPVYRGFEIQVLDDFGKLPTKNRSGAIYDVVTPMFNVSLPAGEWNSFDIRVEKQRVQVTMNGWRVVDANLAQMDKPLGKFDVAYKDLPLAGNLALQDHGGEVWYRNLLVRPLGPSTPATNKDSGYRGIWYYNQPTGDQYAFKYAGGLGTYCAQHIPFAVYAPEVNKTFFVYGGAKDNENRLMEMVSYFDHATGEVPRPTILMNKGTDDAHDNPVISLDDEGYIWVFASSHGTARPSYIFKSTAPYATDAFETVLETNFSYPQPWHMKGKGFLFLQTLYKRGRGLHWQTSPDGRTWSEPKLLAHMQEGHYQMSWPYKDEKVGTAFNYHPTAFQGNPKKKGLNWRTNLYYIETNDMGATWRTVTGESIQTPITEVKNKALIYNYEQIGQLVYVVDMTYDNEGRPILLYVVSTSWEPDPAISRALKFAHWTGSEWDIREITAVDNNYDMGSIYVEADGTWRVIAPAATGFEPQLYNTGGEVAMLTSRDEGHTWDQVPLTKHSQFNHTHCRKVLNANPDFYAFWADGHGRRQSDSRLYFSNKSGEVFQLPTSMKGESAKPKLVPIVAP